MDDAEISKIKEVFLREQNSYKALAHQVSECIKDSLKSNNIKTAYVLSRIKDVDSFLDKIHRKKYRDPFNQMSDIIGIRVVCLYTEDTHRVDKLIENNFSILKREYKLDKLGSDRMGYQDLHIDAKLKDSDAGLKSHQFEIQVRAIMLDAISIISHDLSYKKETYLPEKLQRELNLAFATMELTQYHCDSLRGKREEYTKEIVEEAGDGSRIEAFLNQPIIDDTLRVYTNKMFPGLPIKENIHLLILRDLNVNKYKTLKDIDAAVIFSEKFVEYYKTQSDSFKSGSDYITKSLGYYDKEFREKHPFASKTINAMIEFENRRN